MEFIKKIKNLIKKIKMLKRKIKLSIKKTIKNIINFIFPEGRTRNIKGIFQLLLIFGLLLISFRFTILKSFFSIVKNGLSFISLMILMISYKFISKE